VLFALLVLCLLLFVVLPFHGATLWALLGALLVGLLWGVLARLIVPNSGPMGCLTTSLVGLFGSLLGTAVARAMDDTGGLGRFLLQLAGAVVLVLLVRPTRGARP
jgi:uncharacterized membrane protein YeaQ/YmgE (transglycosylase-associated protein family)